MSFWILLFSLHLPSPSSYHSDSLKGDNGSLTRAATGTFQPNKTIVMCLHFTPALDESLCVGCIWSQLVTSYENIVEVSCTLGLFYLFQCKTTWTVCVCVSLQVQSGCSESWFKACYVHPCTLIEPAYWPPTVIWPLGPATNNKMFSCRTIRIKNIISLFDKQDYVPDRFSTFYLHKGLKAKVLETKAMVHGVLPSMLINSSFIQLEKLQILRDV